jgi:hypothetical protein
MPGLCFPTGYVPGAWSGAFVWSIIGSASAEYPSALAPAAANSAARGSLRGACCGLRDVFGLNRNPYPAGWLDVYGDAWNLLKLEPAEWSNRRGGVRRTWADSIFRPGYFTRGGKHKGRMNPCAPR